MRTLAVWVLVGSAAVAECLSITGDRIVASDLAKAIPEFSSAAGDSPLSFAPIPGLTRNLKASEVAMFAKRLKISLDEGSAHDVCFLSEAAVLTEDQIRTAVLAAIPFPVVALKVLDFSRLPIPPGRLEFPETGLKHPSTRAPETAVWHGRLVRDAGHSFPVWAKLSIVVEAKIVVSAHEIARNQILTAGDLAYLDQVAFPLPEGVVRSIDEITGRSALRSFAKGSAIAKWALEQPREVLQGETVHVDAISGDAHLSFEARAQTSGRRGDLITIHNPNGHSFKARVIEKGRVEVRSARED